MFKGRLKERIFPAFYILAMALVVLYAWNQHNVVSRGGDSPLYKNLMDNRAYIKRGFDLDAITPRNSFNSAVNNNSEWYQFDNPPFKIINSPLPDLPKRTFLSPFGMEKEEFTIIIPVEIDSGFISYLEANPTIIPGINFTVIGENWEVYLNGTLIQSGMYKYNQTYRNVHFPFDKNLIVSGTNILALRILGDPAYEVTGLTFKTHHYLDDYRIIERRQRNFPLIALCIIFGFTGFYYLILFFTIGNRTEISNLYFGIFSVLLCMYTLTRHSIINALIPNSDISVRIEYSSMIMMFPVLFLFVETLVRGKITRGSRIFLCFSVFLTLIQIIFSNQFGQDVVTVWEIIIIAYSAYFIFYKLIFLFFKNKESLNTRVVIALVGVLGLFACGVYEILQILVFHNDINVFHYSIFILHLGMAFNLAQNFIAMDKKLAQFSSTLNELQRTKAKTEDVIIGALRFDLVSGHVFYEDSDLQLAPKEFALLYTLACREGKTLSARHLYETVWNNPYSEQANATLRVHIANLKKKIDAVTHEIILESLRDEGYSLYLQKIFNILQ